MSVGEYEVALRTRYLDAKRNLLRGQSKPVPVVSIAPPIPRTARVKRRSLVSAILRNQLKLPTMQKVVMDTSKKHDVAPLLVAGQCRSRNVVAARNEVFAILHEGHGISLQRIGHAFGKDHTTVWYAIRRYHGEHPDTIKPGLANRNEKRTKNS